MADKDTKRGGCARTFLSVICVFLFLVLAMLMFVVGFVENKLNLMNRPVESQPTLSSEEIEAIENETDPEDAGNTAPEIAPDEVTWATEPGEVIGGEEKTHIINILLIGQDRREGQGRQRSDAMILCTVNKEAKTLTMTSFQRDTYLQIPGYQDNRINAAYVFGGMPLLDETLYVNYGVQVDGNVEVDFNGFVKVVNMLGGVEIELTGSEAGVVNRANPAWAVKAGMNNLTGEQALEYARIRKLDNDFGRTNRQRKVLISLFNKCKGLSLTKLNALLDEILPMVTTDLSNQQIIGYAVELFPLLTELTVTTQHIPADGTYRGVRIRGMSVLVPDLEANRQILIDTLLGE